MIHSLNIPLICQSQADPLATCRSYVRCLEEVLSTLDDELGLDNVPPHAASDICKVKGRLQGLLACLPTCQ